MIVVDAIIFLNTLTAPSICENLRSPRHPTFFYGAGCAMPHHAILRQLNARWLQILTYYDAVKTGSSESLGWIQIVHCRHIFRTKFIYPIQNSIFFGSKMLCHRKKHHQQLDQHARKRYRHENWRKMTQKHEILQKKVFLRIFELLKGSSMRKLLYEKFHVFRHFSPIFMYTVFGHANQAACDVLRWQISFGPKKIEFFGWPAISHMGT